VCLAPFLVPVAWWGGGLKTVDQAVGRCRHFVHRSLKYHLIGARRPRRAAELAHELQRGRADLVVRRRGLEIRQRLDVSAHAQASPGIRETG